MERCKEIYDRIVAGGQEVIKNFIVEREAEHLFLDFKRSSDNGNGRNLSNNDRNNIAKAISGFGNSEGGVIVWGVDCSRDDADGADVAHTLVYINNPVRFSSSIQGVISGCTIPPHSGVESHPISIDDNRGFVVMLIPKSNSAPHQMLNKKQYYIRAGSDFVPISHDVLAGMFGRRPQAHVYHNYILSTPELVGSALNFSFGLLIHSDGPGIASDIFCTCTSEMLPSDNSEMSFELSDQTNWTGSIAFGMQVSLISATGYRLPPKAKAQPLIVHLSLVPPFNEGLKISGSVGSGSSRIYEFKIERSASQLQEIYESFIQQANLSGDHESTNFLSVLFENEESL